MKVTLEILFEDNHLLVVNKPSGIPVQKPQDERTCLEDIAKLYIKEKYNKPGEVFLGVTHRIDTPVSGAVIFTKTSKALSRINEAFRLKQVNKIYWAAVYPAPEAEEASLTHWLKKAENKNISRAYPRPVDGAQESKLNYRTIAQTKHYALLEIQLITGRHHQIRAQLSAIGCPVKGDVKYGFKRGNRDGSIHLHSRIISFPHPVGGAMMKIVAPVPDEVLWKELEAAASA